MKRGSFSFPPWLWLIVIPVAYYFASTKGWVHRDPMGYLSQFGIVLGLRDIICIIAGMILYHILRKLGLFH